MRRLMIDMDGVLADFNTSYIKLLEEISGIRLGLPEGWLPPEWDYAKRLGFSPAHETEAWRQIEAGHFWFSLLNMPDALPMLDELQDLSKTVEVFYVTSRPGQYAKYQTELWLNTRGIDFPTVIVSSQKGAVCRALNITHALDDRDVNCMSIAIDAPNTKTSLLVRPWNERWASQAHLYNVTPFLLAHEWLASTEEAHEPIRV